jgi:hypothetical protein
MIEAADLRGIGAKLSEVPAVGDGPARVALELDQRRV